MRKLLFVFLMLIGLNAFSQEKEKVQAVKGVIYGVVTEATDPITADELKNKVDGTEYDGLITAKVVEVCKAEGCWIKVARKDGVAMMVRSKNHAFLLPENIVGKTVLIDGSATIKEVSEEMRKHYAEDAGKSAKEIAKIKGSAKDVEFSARGVKVLD